MSKILGFGMVGGGQGAFIGDVHRKAAQFDSLCKLISGCFSRDFNNTLVTGEKFGIDRERLYSSYEEMALKESQREDGIDFVCIVTPNSLHFEVAKTFLEHGIHVVCDKPVTLTSIEAEELQSIAKSHKLLFCVTDAYSGYPMVKHARSLVREGKLGEIRMVMGEYPQEWCLHVKKKNWRFNPDIQGRSGCVGDIGVHIEHTVSYITGLSIETLSARMDHFGDHMELDNNASVMLKYT